VCGKQHLVVLGLLAKPRRRLAIAVKLDEEMRMARAGECEDAPAVGDDGPGEHLMPGPLAVPLGQRAARRVGLDSEAYTELVDLYMMCKLLARRDAGCDRMLPAALRTVPT
jgi:hypothetical protein